MKYIITESQYKLLTEDRILKLDFDVFNNDWDVLQKFLELRGNPSYIITGDLDLRNYDIKTLGSLVGVEGNLNLGYNQTIESLGNLKSIGGYLFLEGTNIKSLGNLQYVGGELDLYGSKIKSLGNLESVGGYLELRKSNIRYLGNLKSVGGCLSLGYTNTESLGNLEYVGGYLDLRLTPLSRTTTKEEIREIPNLTIEGEIYL